MNRVAAWARAYASRPMVEQTISHIKGTKCRVNNPQGTISYAIINVNNGSNAETDLKYIFSLHRLPALRTLEIGRYSKDLGPTYHTKPGFGTSRQLTEIRQRKIIERKVAARRPKTSYYLIRTGTLRTSSIQLVAVTAKT